MMIEEQIEAVVNQINRWYREFNTSYYGESMKGSFNLKKLSATAAIQDSDFRFDMAAYLQAVGDFEAELVKEKDALPVDVFRRRVKSYGTAWNKLVAKSALEQANGAFPLRKVINDLLGFRIILPGVTENQATIDDFLDKLLAQGKIARHYYRQDQRYRAFHCYFRQNNFQYPWELQIWDQQDEAVNIYEHARHEQDRQDILEGRD